MIPGQRVLVLRCGHISHIVKMHYLLLYQYSTLIPTILREYNDAFLWYCCFLFFDNGLLICKYEPFWQEVSIISDTRWSLRSVSLLFNITSLLYPKEEKGYYLIKDCWKMITFEGFLSFRIVFKQALVFPQTVNIRRTTKCIAQTQTSMMIHPKADSGYGIGRV